MSLDPKEMRTIGRYSLLKRIASGGMGEIHLARLTSTQGVERYFAIKLLLPQFAREARIVDMFVTEARIAARIQHPNVCQVYELGTEDNELFICMEFLQGVSVAKILTSHTPVAPVPIGIAASIVEQACAGLQFAHELKDDEGNSLEVVHRDVSPGNLFLTSSGIAKILDFGVVKANDKAIKTQTGVLKGKMGYMSPEQITGTPIDHRSDIFSLGIVLFELLTNRRLFSRDTEFHILRAILEEPVEKLRNRRPDLPSELEDVVSKALSQDVNGRFSTMKEFGDALRAAMVGNGGLASTLELSEFMRKKYAKALEASDELLQYSKTPPAVLQAEEITKCIDTPPAPTVQEFESEATAKVEPAPITPPQKSKTGTWALALLGGAVLVLAATIFITKDNETTQSIVIEGNVSREQALRGDANERSAPKEKQNLPPVSDGGLATATVSTPKSRCASKGTLRARNTCQVTLKSRALQKCLQKHAVDVTGTPELTLDFFLNSRGKIQNMEVKPTAIGASALGQCVRRIALAIRFGPQKNDVKFSVPLRINLQ